MEQGEQMTKLLRIHRDLLIETLTTLKRAGHRRKEGITLWLGERGGAIDEVKLPYEPIHEASVDYFHIPPHGVQALMRKMEATETCVVAQIHSHPQEAFHSQADDHWAIVRHIGAFSLVLPNFALLTSLENFMGQVAVFRLGADDQWCQMVAASALEIVG